MFFYYSNQHSVKVKNFFLDVLSPLITEADNLSVELLDLILINIVEPNKSANKYAYELTEQLLVKTGDAFEATIKLVKEIDSLMKSNLITVHVLLSSSLTAHWSWINPITSSL